MKEAKASSRELRSKVNKTKTELSNTESTLNDLQSELDNIINESNLDVAEDRKNWQNKMEQLTAQLSNLKETKESLLEERSEADAEHHATKDRLLKARAMKPDAERRIQSCKARLRELEGSKHNRLARFGELVPQFLEEIQRNRGRFSTPPLGPLGNFITVRDPQWIVACEAAMGGILTAFWVSNFEDQKTLSQLFNRVISQNRHSRQKAPLIICSNVSRQPYNWQKAQPLVQRNIPVILDVVEVANSTVLNVIIDQCSAESAALVQSRNNATQLVRNWPGGHGAPPVVYMPKGAKVSKNAGGGIVNSGGGARARYFGGEVSESDIRNARDNIVQAERSLSTVQRDCNQFEASCRDIVKGLRRLQKDLDNIDSEISGKEGDLQSAQEALDRINQGLDEDLAAGIREQMAPVVCRFVRMDH